MAQTISSTAVGRVNRRFLLLAFVLAALSAVLVYAALSKSGPQGGSGTSGTVAVVVAKQPIAAGTTIAATMLELRQVPPDAVGDGAFSTIEATVGQTARYPISINDQILLSKVVAGIETGAGNGVLSHIIETGRRGLGLRVEAVVNGGGLALPGDHVDVYWVPDKVLQDLTGAMLIAENVEVLAVQQTLEDLPAAAPGVAAQPTPGGAAQPRIRGSEADPVPDASTVTLLLTPEEAARVFCADASQGAIRLAVRAFGDNSPAGQPLGTCVVKADQTP